MHKSSVTVVGFIGKLDLFWPRFTRSLKQQYVYMHLQVEAFYKALISQLELVTQLTY